MAPFPNFALPPHTYDTYSLAVLLLRLHGGKTWCHHILKLPLGGRRWLAELHSKGLVAWSALLANTLSQDAARRPLPSAFSAFLAKAVCKRPIGEVHESGLCKRPRTADPAMNVPQGA